MKRTVFWTVGVTALLSSTQVFGQEPAAASERTLLDLIQAGGWVGYAIILLSLVGIALIVDGFLRLREEVLVPAHLTEQIHQLASARQFEQLLGLCRGHDSLVARVIVAGLSDGKMGLDAVREAMQQQGVSEITRLRQRIGYIGLIAGIAPMLGLLGTVVGMIVSFRLLGESRGVARPDELALGISQALVTTCMGLIVAVPMMFFHAMLRDRITRIGQDVAAVGDRMLRLSAVAMSQTQGQAQAKAHASKA